jgi:uncharacterized protein
MFISILKVIKDSARFSSIAALIIILVGAAVVWQRSRAPRSGQTSANSASIPPTAFSWLDEDEDGLPDGLSLSGSDAENFRRWFTLIAEYQFYKLSPKWQAEQRDCSGLIRFAMREGLRKHTRSWVVDFGGDARLVAAAPPDVRSYNLDVLPVGERLFRTRDGKFQPADLHDGTMTEFADARIMRAFNTRFVTRDPQQARPGDLVIFYEPRMRYYPFHIMLFLGRPTWEADGSNDWVVYHTGASANDPGIVKKVRLAELLHHPNKRWHPVQTNPGFLGFYRLKIID